MDGVAEFREFPSGALLASVKEFKLERGGLASAFKGSSSLFQRVFLQPKEAVGTWSKLHELRVDAEIAKEAKEVAEKTGHLLAVAKQMLGADGRIIYQSESLLKAECAAVVREALSSGLQLVPARALWQKVIPHAVWPCAHSDFLELPSTMGLGCAFAAVLARKGSAGFDDMAKARRAARRRDARKDDDNDDRLKSSIGASVKEEPLMSDFEALLLEDGVDVKGWSVAAESGRAKSGEQAAQENLTSLDAVRQENRAVGNKDSPNASESVSQPAALESSASAVEESVNQFARANVAPQSPVDSESSDKLKSAVGFGASLDEAEHSNNAYRSDAHLSSAVPKAGEAPQSIAKSVPHPSVTNEVQPDVKSSTAKPKAAIAFEAFLDQVEQRLAAKKAPQSTVQSAPPASAEAAQQSSAKSSAKKQAPTEGISSDAGSSVASEVLPHSTVKSATAKPKAAIAFEAFLDQAEQRSASKSALQSTVETSPQPAMGSSSAKLAAPRVVAPESTAKTAPGSAAKVAAQASAKTSSVKPKAAIAFEAFLEEAEQRSAANEATTQTPPAESHAANAAEASGKDDLSEAAPKSDVLSQDASRENGAAVNSSGHPSGSNVIEATRHAEDSAANVGTRDTKKEVWIPISGKDIDEDVVTALKDVKTAVKMTEQNARLKVAAAGLARAPRVEGNAQSPAPSPAAKLSESESETPNSAPPERDEPAAAEQSGGFFASLWSKMTGQKSGKD